MRIITWRRLADFIERHPQAESAMAGWRSVVTGADWRTFAQVRETFASADLVGDLIVFNVGGGRYRIVAHVPLRNAQVYIKHVFTHAEYDRWNRDRR